MVAAGDVPVSAVILHNQYNHDVPSFLQVSVHDVSVALDVLCVVCCVLCCVMEQSGVLAVVEDGAYVDWLSLL